MDLYQHEETGRLVWLDHRPSDLWHKTPHCSKDEILEEMTRVEYDWWLENSTVINGVRVGPCVGRPVEKAYTQEDLELALSYDFVRGFWINRQKERDT